MIARFMVAVGDLFVGLVDRMPHFEKEDSALRRRALLIFWAVVTFLFFLPFGIIYQAITEYFDAAGSIAKEYRRYWNEE